jgi:hypothetical protein
MEAKVLCEFDKTGIFHVETILSSHARLWKCGVADTFVGSYRLRLDAMRLLLSKKNPSEVDPALVSSAERLAKEACGKANEDLVATYTQGLGNSNKIKKILRRKRSKDVADLYYWDKIISDWKDRGLWQKLVAAWQLSRQ